LFHCSQAAGHDWPRRRMLGGILADQDEKPEAESAEGVTGADAFAEKG
jgi:hypothetical protein